MLRGDAWVDGVGAVVCHDKWSVRGAVLTDGELVLHMMRVQAIGIVNQSQHACRQPVFHAEDVRREPGSNDEASDGNQVRTSRGKLPIESYRLM
jgi:hypothetical protein